MKKLTIAAIAVGAFVVLCVIVFVALFIYTTVAEYNAYISAPLPKADTNTSPDKQASTPDDLCGPSRGPCPTGSSS